MALLVAGSGYVGSALGALRRAQGRRVYALSRSLGSVASGVEPVRADLTDGDALVRALPDDVDEVAYTAAADDGGLDAYRRAYVVGLETLLRALVDRRLAVRRVVFTSSTGVYADTDGLWVDETTPAEPTRDTGRVLLEAEQTLARGPFPGVTLRLAGIYGPGRTRLVDQVRRGEPSRGQDDRWTNRIHRDDCAGAIDHLLGLDAPEPLYVGVDDLPVRLGEVRAWIARELGVPLPDEPGDSDGGRGDGLGKRCRNTRLVQSGYRFRHPTFREGYGAMIAEGA